MPVTLDALNAAMADERIPNAGVDKGEEQQALRCTSQLAGPKPSTLALAECHQAAVCYDGEQRKYRDFCLPALLSR